ncbi:MAG TPA: hypothetical protein VFV99_06390, partial [Kofleriaceae bacterium]|nr:hypothetical protein [Kofleriaceae bacterium]
TREVSLQLLPGFDAAFMVIADDPSALYRVWTRERCEDMLVSFAAGTLRSLGDAIELDWPSDPTIVKVKRGIDFLISLARADVYGMAALRALPDATPTADGYVEIAGPGAIRIGPHRREHSMVTRASASVELDPARTPPPTLGAAALACANGETTIEWLEIEENPTRLTAAIEFLRSLAVAPSEGVFR